jgi:hypothetical protein
METKHKQQLVERYNHEGKRWIVVVTNREERDGKGFEVKTNFFSGKNGFEGVLHKVELDLMTNLHYGFNSPIQIQIQEVGN